MPRSNVVQSILQSDFGIWTMQNQVGSYPHMAMVNNCYTQMYPLRTGGGSMMSQAFLQTELSHCQSQQACALQARQSMMPQYPSQYMQLVQQKQHAHLLNGAAAQFSALRTTPPLPDEPPSPTPPLPPQARRFCLARR